MACLGPTSVMPDTNNQASKPVLDPCSLAYTWAELLIIISRSGIMQCRRADLYKHIKRDSHSCPHRTLQGKRASEIEVRPSVKISCA